MTRCTDTTIGNKLHAWELGMLSEPEIRDFELHLLDCSACLQRVEKFSRVTKLLRHEPQVRATVAELSARQRTVITRYLLAAVLIVAVGFPLYWYGFRPAQTQSVQRLDFTPYRSAGNRIIDTHFPGDVELRFLAPQVEQNQTCTIIVETRDGKALFRDDNFSGLDSARVGLVTLPGRQFVADFYRLLVINRTNDTTIYNFRAR